MKIELADVSNVRKRLTVEVPASDVAAVFDHLLRGYRRNVSIPGFRPGKAPLELVKARVGHDLEHEAAEKIVEDFGREACIQEGLKPIWSDIELPEGVDHLPHPHEGEDYRFTLLVEVMPAIEARDYTGIEITRDVVETPVEEIQKELEGLRQSKGQLHDVTDRASEAGDFVGVELEGREGDEVRVPKEFRVIRLGEERNLPEFERELVNRRADEQVAFEVTYPAEYAEANLAGKTVAFSGTVKAVKRMDVPEWDDDLARSFGGEVADYADLREKIKASIEMRKSAEADQGARQKLLDTLVARHPFDLPGVLVDEELRDRLNRIGRRLESQGLDPEKLEVDWDKVVEEERRRAESAVREGLLLDAIAEKEPQNVVVTREDIDQAVENIARDMQQPVGKLRQFLQKEGRMASLQRELRRTKCLDWLYAQSHIS